MSCFLAQEPSYGALFGSRSHQAPDPCHKNGKVSIIAIRNMKIKIIIDGTIGIITDMILILIVVNNIIPIVITILTIIRLPIV